MDFLLKYVLTDFKRSFFSLKGHVGCKIIKFLNAIFFFSKNSSACKIYSEDFELFFEFICTVLTINES